MKNSIKTVLISMILMSFSPKTQGQTNFAVAGSLRSLATSYTLTSNSPQAEGSVNSTEYTMPKSIAYVSYGTQISVITNSEDHTYGMDTSSELFIYNNKSPFFLANESDEDSTSAKANKLSDDDFFMWSNESEENNIDYFAIEKSIDDEDYFEIGYLKTSGIQPPDYNTSNRMQSSGPLCYYRIKKVDNMGEVKYSKKLIIIASDTTSARSIKITSTNNVNKNIKVSFSLNESAVYMLSITDVNGSMVSTINGNGTKGENNITLDIKKLLKGNYYIYITNAKGLTHVANYRKLN